MDLSNVRIIRSKRKTISLVVDETLQVTVKAPQHIRKDEILRVLAEREDWIEKSRAHILERRQRTQNLTPFTQAELLAYTQAAKRLLPVLVDKYAKVLGVTYGRINIRHQVTRWGSCSSKGNLNFNCLLMAMPPEMAEYTVVHELCHLKEMNHSVRFYRLLESVLPDYRQREKWMRENGNALIVRLRKTQQQERAE